MSLRLYCETKVVGFGLSNFSVIIAFQLAKKKKKVCFFQKHVLFILSEFHLSIVRVSFLPDPSYLQLLLCAPTPTSQMYGLLLFNYYCYTYVHVNLCLQSVEFKQSALKVPRM